MAPGVRDGPTEVGWEIRWHGRPIGWAAYRLRPQPHGVQEADSVVHFDDLPVEKIVRELFGPLAGWIHADWTAGDELRVPMQVDTQMVFDPLADSQRFSSTVHLGTIRGLLTLTGTALDGRLHLVMTAHEGLGEMPPGAIGLELYRGDVELPSRMSTASLLSPLTNLRNLRMGQTWMFQAYRPVPFGPPVQLARAEVEGEELMDWQDRRELVRHVVIRYVEQAQPERCSRAGWPIVGDAGWHRVEAARAAGQSID